MPDYKAPLRDIRFVMNELLNSEQHYASLPGCEDATVDMVDAILVEGAKFAEQELAPLNRIGISKVVSGMTVRSLLLRVSRRLIRALLRVAGHH